jgi:hypothetical protein
MLHPNTNKVIQQIPLEAFGFIDLLPFLYFVPDLLPVA